MKENRNRKLILLTVVIVGLCIVCGIQSAVLLFHKDTASVAPTQNISLNTEATEIESEESEQDMIYFSGFDDTTIDLGSSIMLPCDISNAEGCIYINYTVLDKEGSVLYDSGLIEPGKAVEWTPELAAGEYNITLHEQPYQLVDKEGEPTEDNLTALYYVDQTIHVTIK